MTSQTPPRLAREDAAGNVFYEQEQYGIYLPADYTLTDSNVAQKAFNNPSAGQITLPASTAYEFEALYLMTNAGTTAHTWAVLFAGTASLTALDFGAMTTQGGITSPATLNTVAANEQANAAGALPTTALVVTASSTAAAEHIQVRLRGILRINAGGTLIPQVKLSAATAGASKMLRGSFFRMSPIGSDTIASLGPWT